MNSLYSFPDPSVPLAFQPDPPRYPERDPHFRQQEHDRGAPVADERKGNARGGQHARDNGDIQDDLQSNVCKYARRDQRSIQIRCILGDKHQPVQQKPEQEKDDKRPEYPQLLTDHHQDHIILGLRDHPQLLGAVAKPFPEEPAACRWHTGPA